MHVVQHREAAFHGDATERQAEGTEEWHMQASLHLSLLSAFLFNPGDGDHISISKARVSINPWVRLSEYVYSPFIATLSLSLSLSRCVCMSVCLSLPYSFLYLLLPFNSFIHKYISIYIWGLALAFFFFLFFNKYLRRSLKIISYAPLCIYMYLSYCYSISMVSVLS